MSEQKRQFKFARRVTLKDFEEGKPIMSADYTFIQENGPEPAIYQCDLVEEEDQEIKFKMDSNIYKLDYENNQLVAKTIETQDVGFLESSSAFESLSTEIDAFFNSLPVYEELKIKHPKRGALLYSVPGCGKTSGILQIAKQYTANGDTCVLIWPSDVVKSEEIEHFLGKQTDWSGISKLIICLEDIGGGATDAGMTHGKIPASLLNFLDGINSAFLKPTYIIATSNNPDALNSAITSRPGRFDAVIQVKTPDASSRVKFLKFFATEKYYTLDKEKEKELVKLTDGFSIAHLKEVYIRSRLFNKTMLETAKEMKRHVLKVKEGLTAQSGGTMGFEDEVDPFE
jgi:ATP-dependent 26S proteasome regulatory subunit